MAFGSYRRVGQGGTGVLMVDGKEVATKQMARTLPFILQWVEALDIGSDTGTPVNDADYKLPFAFTGTLGKITLTVDRPKLSPEDVKKLQEAQKAQAAAKQPSARVRRRAHCVLCTGEPRVRPQSGRLS